MKQLLYSLVLFVLTACSNNEQRFVCGNEGLIITKNKATLGVMDNLKFCSKSGTVNFYSTDCSKDAKSPFILSFDTVSLTYTENGTITKQCKKVN